MATATRDEAIRAMEALEERGDELRVQYRDTIARLDAEGLSAQACRERIALLGEQLAGLTQKLDAIERAAEPPDTYAGPQSQLRRAQSDLFAQLDALEEQGDLLHAEREHAIRRLAEHERQAQACRERRAHLEAQMREVAARLDVVSRGLGQRGER